MNVDMARLGLHPQGELVEEVTEMCATFLHNHISLMVLNNCSSETLEHS